MKKLSILFASGVLLLMACGKTNVTSNDAASALFINAAPGSTTHNVLVDDVNQTGTALVYRAASLYLNIKEGARKINLRTNNPALTTDYVTLTGESFSNNTASTFVTYDILATPTSGLKSIRLYDDLTTPKAGFIKVRYLPLATGTALSDITFLRTTNILPALPDSVTVSNQDYIGPQPLVATLATLQKFIEIPAGGYIVKQKLAGTQTVIATLSTGTITSPIGGIYRGIFTIYSAGNAAGQPLTLTGVRHYP